MFAGCRASSRPERANDTHVTTPATSGGQETTWRLSGGLLFWQPAGVQNGIARKAHSYFRLEPVWQLAGLAGLAGWPELAWQAANALARDNSARALPRPAASTSRGALVSHGA